MIFGNSVVKSDEAMRLLVLSSTLHISSCVAGEIGEAVIDFGWSFGRLAITRACCQSRVGPYLASNGSQRVAERQFGFSVPTGRAHDQGLERWRSSPSAVQ